MANKQASLHSKVTVSVDTCNKVLLGFLAGCFFKDFFSNCRKLKEVKKRRKNKPAFNGQKDVKWGINDLLGHSRAVHTLTHTLDFYVVCLQYTEARATLVATQVITLTKNLATLKTMTLSCLLLLQPLFLSSSHQIGWMKYSWGYLNDKGGEVGQIQRGPGLWHMTENCSCYCFLFLCFACVKMAERCPTRYQSRKEMSLRSWWKALTQKLPFNYHHIVISLFLKNGARDIC